MTINELIKAGIDPDEILAFYFDEKGLSFNKKAYITGSTEKVLLNQVRAERCHRENVIIECLYKNKDGAQKKGI